MIFMDNAFAILAGFLDHCGAEVMGREHQEPSAEIEAKLKQFARGKLAAADHAELLGQLGRHPEWVGRLADEVKGLRVQS